MQILSLELIVCMISQIDSRFGINIDALILRGITVCLRERIWIHSELLMIQSTPEHRES
jgi:hypothetical protein